MHLFLSPISGSHHCPTSGHRRTSPEKVSGEFFSAKSQIFSSSSDLYDPLYHSPPRAATSTTTTNTTVTLTTPPPLTPPSSPTRHHPPTETPKGACGIKPPKVVRLIFMPKRVRFGWLPPPQGCVWQSTPPQGGAFGIGSAARGVFGLAVTHTEGCVLAVTAD
ncbi:hypothetical protein Tco_0810531 [Tanacetum coccineum]